MMSIVSDQHERSPNKILRGHQKGDRKEKNSRAEMTVTLTEHLWKSYLPESPMLLIYTGTCKLEEDFNLHVKGWAQYW